MSTAEERKAQEPSPLEIFNPAEQNASISKGSRSKNGSESLLDTGLLPIFREFGYIFLGESEKEQEFYEQLERYSDAIAVLSQEGAIYWFNSVFEDLFGFNKKELKSSTVFNFLQHQYQYLMQIRLNEAGTYISREIGTVKDRIASFRGYNGYGELRSFETICCGFWRNGDIRIVLAIRDVTPDSSTLLELNRLEKNYNILSETINEAIVRIDENFTIAFANNAVKRTFGYSKEELYGKQFSILFPPEIYERHEEDFKKYFFIDHEHRDSIGLKPTIEVLGSHKSRGVSPMEISFGNSTDFLGRTLTCVFRDITNQKNTERQLRKLAYHDKITNLGNRDLFQMELEQFFAQVEKYPMLKGSLMFLDLDGFKQINDTLGHNVGDTLLEETAKRLRESLRVSDGIYRFGGDEFVILLKQVKTKRDASKVAHKILSAVGHPYYLATKDENKQKTVLNIGVSIGIALFPEDGDDVHTLIQRADLAMYESKKSGKNRYSFYHKDLVSRATKQLRIEQGIKHALYNNQFELHYQPLVDIEGRVQGLEALLRWQDPKMGEINPAEFIPIAEEKGLIKPLGTWILETACRQLNKIMQSYDRSLFMSVNLSPLQLEDGAIVDKLNSIIKRSGIDTSRLKLEITESNIMKHPDSVISKIEQVKENNSGIQMVIDDFGTGYSSLSYLSKLPIDAVKIDISFVSHLHSIHNKKIIQTILTLAESLDLSVVAEGVETKEQWDYFKGTPKVLLQGYHFSRPLSSEKLNAYLKKHM